MIDAPLKTKPRTKPDARINRKSALRYAVEQLEPRTLLSVTAITLAGPYNIAGTTKTYQYTIDGVVQSKLLTQILTGETTFQGIKCYEQEGGVDGRLNLKGYYGFDSSGNFVEYGGVDVLTSETQTTVYTPPRLVVAAVVNSGVSFTSNWASTFTDKDFSGNVLGTDTGSGNDVITLKSPGPVPVTVGSTTYQAYDFTDIETEFDSSGVKTTVTNNEDWVVPSMGVVQTIAKTQNLDNSGAVTSSATTLVQLTKFSSAGDHLAVTRQPKDTPIGGVISPSITVEVENSSSIVDATATDTITASIAVGSTGSGVLSGMQSVSAVGGVATFPGLMISQQGTYSLLFTDANNLTTTSVSFNIGVVTVENVSTNDSKSMTVQYYVAANDADTSFPLNIYRTANPTYTVGAPNQVSIANMTISGADAMAGDHSIVVSPAFTISPYQFLQVNALRPDPAHKYVVATADETGALDPSDAQVILQNYFRIWLIGAVTHGYVGDGWGPLNSELPTDEPGDYQPFVDEFASNLETIDGYDRAIAFHWEQYADLAKPDQPVNQGLRLYQNILSTEASLLLGTNDVVDLNLIGWSRGTIVVNSALTRLSTDPSVPKALASGFICESLVDPHPANNLISDASVGSGAAAGVVSRGYRDFQDATADLQGVGFIIPPNVYAVSDMYQENTVASMSGSEALLNLWGLSPTQITPNQNTKIINKQVITPGIGHSEIMVNVERDIIKNNNTLRELNLYPFGDPFAPPDTTNSLSTPSGSFSSPTIPAPSDVERASAKAAAITRAIAATRLVFTGQAPSTVVGNSAFSVTVSAEDGSGNVDTSFTGPVTLALGQNLLDGSLKGTLTANAVAGVATFNNLSIYQPGVYTVVAAGTGLTNGSSSTFTVTTPAAQRLVIEPLTNTVLTNGAFTLTVDAEDAFGAIDTNYSAAVSIALLSPSGGSLAGTLTATATNGVATFSGLSVNKVGSDQITAASAGLAGGATPWFVVSDDELVVTTSPGDAPLGSSFGMIVSAENSAGIDTSFNGLITLVPSTAPDGSQPALGGTFARPAIGGTAVFFGLTLNEVGAYTLAATAEGAASGRSDSFTVTGGAATKLALANQPSSPVTVGAPFEIDVATEDAQGNVDESFNGQVTLTVATGPGTLGGTTTVNASDGLVAFTGITLGATGSYTLTATGDGFSITTSAITISVTGVATNLTFTANPPSSVTAGATFGVTVTAVDSFGTTDTTFTGPITLSANLDGTPVTTLGGTLTVNAVAGVATFTSLTENIAGVDYTISATAPGLFAAIPSGTFAVAAGPATMFVINMTQSVVPGSPFSVTVFAEDALGNTDAAFNAAVTLSLLSAPGQTLGGTLLVNAINGIAAFANLTLSVAGSANTLQATSGSLTGTATVSASPDQLVVTTSPPELVTVGGAFGLTVSAIAGGTVDTSFTGPVTVSLVQLGSTSATLGGTLTVNAVAGVATFSQLAINASGAYQLAVSSASGAGSAATDTINVSSAVSPAASTIVPTFGRLKLPGSGIAGQRFVASIPLGLKATSAATGTFIIYLYADQTETLDGRQVLLGRFPESVSLKSGKVKTSTLRLKSLPMSLPAGVYHVLAEVIDPANGTALVAAPATIAVVAPVVTLAASAAVHPTTVKSGKVVSVTLTVSNSGNIAASGNITAIVAASSDGTAAGITGTLASPPAHAIRIAAGGHSHLSLKFKAPVAPAAFFPYVTLTLGSATATAVGPMVTV